MASQLIRRNVFYSGRVQGVGFRYTARQIAGRFAVAGYVRNLPDRRVELVAEGQTDEIERFLSAIAEAMEGNIRDAQSTQSPATGEFADFEIRHQ